MNPGFIKSIDRFLGIPLCAVLSLFELCRRAFDRPSDAPPRKILFVKLVEMGSIAMAGRAFQEAEQQVGKQNLYILVFERNRPVVDLLDVFPSSHVFTVKDDSPGSFVVSACRTLAKIRHEKIDAVVDMEFLSRASAIIGYLTGASKRAGFSNFTSEGPYRGRLFTHEINYTFHHHVSSEFLFLLHALIAEGGQVPVLKEQTSGDLSQPLSYVPPKEEVESMKGQIKRLAGDDVLDKKIVVFSPNTRDLVPFRRWPKEKYIELGKLLLGEVPDIRIIITGNASEKGDAQSIAEAIDRKRVFSLAGKTDLRELMTLYGLCRVIVASDSGPCHFASLTPINIVALFGPETPTLYSPLGNNVITLSAGLSCSPCVNIINHRFSPCRGEVTCMESITVGEVFDAVLKQLG